MSHQIYFNLSYVLCVFFFRPLTIYYTHRWSLYSVYIFSCFIFNWSVYKRRRNPVKMLENPKINMFNHQGKSRSELSSFILSTVYNLSVLSGFNDWTFFFDKMEQSYNTHERLPFSLYIYITKKQKYIGPPGCWTDTQKRVMQLCV